MKTQITLEQVSGEIIRLCRQCDVEVGSASDLRNYSGTIRVEVGTVTGRLKAFCANRIERGLVLVDQLLVHPESRNQGLGTKLLREVVGQRSSAVVFADPSHADASDFIEWLTTSSGYHFARMRVSPRASRVAYVMINQPSRFSYRKRQGIE